MSNAYGIRQQFSTPENILMSAFGAHFVKIAGELLAVDDQVPDLAFRERRYLFLADIAAWPVLDYDYNTLDQNAILGFHPEIKELVFCNGFSGHGVQQAPVAGRAIAELLAYGEFRSLDLSRLGYGRISTNQPLKEVNVV